MPQVCGWWGGGDAGDAEFGEAAFEFDHPAAVFAGEGQPVVGQECDGHTVAGEGVLQCGPGVGGGFAGRGVGADVEAGVVVEDLDDADLLPVGEVVFHAVDLPAAVGVGVFEPAPRAGFLAGLGDDLAVFAQDPVDRGRDGVVPVSSRRQRMEIGPLSRPSSASSLRVRSTASATSGPIAVGWWCGVVLRRVNPSVPSVRKRFRYLWNTPREMPCSRQNRAMLMSSPAAAWATAATNSGSIENPALPIAA